MSRSRWLAPAVAVATTAAVVTVGSVVPPPSAVSQQPKATSQPLSGAVRLCPGALDSPETSAEVAAVSLADDPSSADEQAGPSTLELLDLTELAGGLDAGDAGGVGGVGEVSDAASAAPLAATGRVGETIEAVVEGPVLVRAAGSLAPGLVSESTVSAAGERTSGLAGHPCLEPARDLWFAAGSGAVGRRATLLLANPSSSAVVADVELWNEVGPVSTAGTSDLGIPAFGTRTVALDAVALGSERIAAHVRTQVGRVSAALLLREIDGADPVGLSWVTPSRPPSLRAYVPGLPAFGERTLRLLNPGEQDAIAALRVVAGSGVFTPVGLEAIDVPAGEVVEVDLDPAGEEAFALEVEASEPVVSAVEVRQTPRSGLGDFAVIGSARTVNPLAASLLTSDDARTSRLVLTALPDDPEPGGDGAPGGEGADGDEGEGDGGGDPVGGATASPTESPSPTEAPQPTDGPLPTDVPPLAPAEPTSEPAATGAQATPAATSAATPSPSPTSEAAEDDLVDVAVPTTQVVVSLLGLDSRVLRARVLTLAVGTTEAVTIELPDDVTDAWLVVEPTERGLILAARETTTTVDVPDPLDPDTEQEAFWLDLVALRPAVFAVRVPPVLPDVQAAW